MQENRDIPPSDDLVRYAPENQAGDPTSPMGGHGDDIHMIPLCELQDPLGGMDTLTGCHLHRDALIPEENRFILEKLPGGQLLCFQALESM